MFAGMASPERKYPGSQGTQPASASSASWYVSAGLQRWVGGGWGGGVGGGGDSAGGRACSGPLTGWRGRPWGSRLAASAACVWRGRPSRAAMDRGAPWRDAAAGSPAQLGGPVSTGACPQRRARLLSTTPPHRPPAAPTRCVCSIPHQGSQYVAPASTAASGPATPERSARLPTGQCKQGTPVGSLWSARPSVGLYWPAGHRLHSAASGQLACRWLVLKRNRGTAGALFAPAPRELLLPVSASPGVVLPGYRC